MGRQTFKHKSVLVTGAGGSIGSALCNRVVHEDARKLTLVSLTESALYRVEKGLRRNYAKYRDTEIVPVLGDYGDSAMMSEVLEDVDIVVHAGAHKHVPLCESNPLAAIRNNVMGTYALMDACNSAGVDQFCAISSDKAVKPKSVMGATKRLVELMCMDRFKLEGTSYFVVRFGNVMNSDGSVLPLWREQISNGGPVTLTDERCERYFMTIDEAVDLISHVVGLDPSLGVYVFDMGKPKRMVDIARDLMHEMGKSVGIETIGLRPGEKLTEELSYGGPLEHTSHPKIMRVRDAARLNEHMLRDLFDATVKRSSDRALGILWDLVR